MTPRRLILTYREATAWHAGRLSAVVRLCPDVPEQVAANCHPGHQQKHPAPYLDAYCSERKTDANPRGMSAHWCWWQVDDRQCLPTFRCPLGAPSQRLWIAEAWRVWDCQRGETEGDIVTGKLGNIALDRVEYAADGGSNEGPWRSPATMPQPASRSTAVHLGSRIVRVQELTEDEAKACGVIETRLPLAECTVWSMTPWPTPICGDSAGNAFQAQFIRDHGQAAWDRNDFVWLHRIGRE